jgi:hypothetical protein
VRDQVRQALPFAAPFLEEMESAAATQKGEIAQMHAEINRLRQDQGKAQAELRALRGRSVALEHRAAQIEHWKSRRLVSKIKVWRRRILRRS